MDDKIEFEIKNIKSILEKYYGDRRLGLHEPQFCQEDINAVSECVRSTFVSSVGGSLTKFEKELTQLTGRSVCSVVNGTAALYLALSALCLPKGSLVIVPTISFVATVSILKQLDLVPYLVDVSEVSLHLDFNSFETKLYEEFDEHDDGRLFHKGSGKLLSAVVSVDAFGQVADLTSWRSFCDSSSTALISDSAAALGAKSELGHANSLADVSIFSFNGNKILTTGGGGAIVSKNIDFIARCSHLASTAKTLVPFEFIHDDYGFNLRLPAINAALGLKQFGRLEQFLHLKKQLHLELNEILIASDVFSCMQHKNSNYWITNIQLNEKFLAEGINISHVCDLFTKHDVTVRRLWQPFHLNQLYNEFGTQDYAVANSAYERTISLPSAPTIEIANSF